MLGTALGSRPKVREPSSDLHDGNLELLEARR